ncbi:MAG: CPBP family intramembrane glutamic endopeptidase [Robiginitalea sp.]|uniref:CPBP family intramembrane glutamic endopeptidase n=1 Tax=Robiginitalea sp. TaxID=1902411 RepID=UPI003C777C9C
MQIQALLDFLKKPRYSADPEAPLSYRLRTLGILLIWALAVSLLLAMLLGVIGALGPWNLEEHAFDTLFEEFSPLAILFLTCIVAPAVEEFIFRGPLWFFRDSRYFPGVFYGFTLAFALVHLSNYPNRSEIWVLAPLLISPQLNIGLFLGFIRVRFGLSWAIVFHATYNAILLGPALLLYELGIPLS